MYEKIEECPLCSNKQFTNQIVCKDYLVSQESFAISQCRSCGFKFTNPRPNIENISKYYKSEDYISHKNKSNNIINWIYKIARTFTLNKKLRIIKKYAQSGNILDIGCATGHFLNNCKKHGYNVVGVEPDDQARKIAIKQNGEVIFKDVFELELKKHFDIITLWHVLEHITNLNESMKKIRNLLNKEGTLIIALPNCNSYDANLYKEFWAAYDLPRHLYHFTPESVKALALNHKFKIKEIIPMKLDSYYISLLSEKNKNNKSNFKTAFLNGFKSNREARQTNNYSSLIYILKK